MRPYTKHEYATIPHVMMTSNKPWNPSYCDNDIDPAYPSFYNNTLNLIQSLPHEDYNVHGEYIHAFNAKVPVPATASDPVPATASDLVPATASDPVPATASDPVPDTSSDPVPAKASFPKARSVLRPASNTLLSHDPMDALPSNGSVDFDAFTADCIFEDAVEDYKDHEQFYDGDTSKASIDFWLNEDEYFHHESIARCVNAAICSNAPSVSDTDLLDLTATNTYSVHEIEFLANGSPRIHTPSTVDYEQMRPYFAWQTTDVIQATFKNSTQYGWMPTSSNGNLFKHYSSPHPGANVPRIYDDFLTDTICSDTPAIDGGETLSQCFFGNKSKFNHGEKIKTTKYYLKALQDCLRKWGAPDRVLCDHAQYQSSNRVLDYLRLPRIGLWQSEAKYQH